jgi:phage terminase large subunit-like protein
VISAAARRAARRLRRVPQDRPRLLFTPSPGLRAFYEEDARRSCVLAANRTGKTYHAIAKVALAAILADRASEPVRLRIMAPTNKLMNDTHGRYLEHFLRGHLERGSRWDSARGFTHGNKAVTVGGSTIQLNSYEQRPDAMASASLHGVLLDEPPPPGHFEEALARVFDTDGWVWMTFTAVNRPVKWLRAIVEDGVQAGDWTFHQIGLSAANCPWYTEEQVQDRIREAARQPWSYRQRIEGAWEGVAIDRCFTGYSDRNQLLVHDLRVGWPRSGRVYVCLSVDHGEGAGHSHWTLLAYQPVQIGGRTEAVIRVLSEWTNPERMSVEREARAVRDMVRAAGLELEHVSWAVGDTNSAGKSEGARSMNELFEQELAKLQGRKPDQPKILFRRALKGPDSVESQVARVNQLLDHTAELDGWSSPSLQIVTSECGRVHDALSYWSGKDDDLKHAADSLRYGTIAICVEVGWVDERLMAA